MAVPDEVFEAVITAQRRELQVNSDADLNAEAWKAVTARFKEIIRSYTGREFPTDPYDQLQQATEAVFKSWNGKRAIDYRNAAGIEHDLGTAVNIQTMVFGNLGDNSATGVFMSRNATISKPHALRRASVSATVARKLVSAVRAQGVGKARPAFGPSASSDSMSQPPGFRTRWISR